MSEEKDPKRIVEPGDHAPPAMREAIQALKDVLPVSYEKWTEAQREVLLGKIRARRARKGGRA